VSREQISRVRETAKKIAEEIEESPIEVNEQTIEVVEDAECCLSDIDAALAESEECCATAVEVLTPKSWREMTDQEILDAGDPMWDDYRERYLSGELTYTAASMEYREHTTRYDQAYESIVGVVNHRDCGCGC